VGLDGENLGFVLLVLGGELLVPLSNRLLVCLQLFIANKLISD
jgi:hypothetical protein